MKLARIVMGADKGVRQGFTYAGAGPAEGTTEEASPAWCLLPCLTSLGIGVEIFPMMGVYNISIGSPSTITGHYVDSLGWGFVNQRMLMQFHAMNSQMKLFSSQELTREDTVFYQLLLVGDFFLDPISQKRDTFQHLTPTLSRHGALCPALHAYFS